MRRFPVVTSFPRRSSVLMPWSCPISVAAFSLFLQLPDEFFFRFRCRQCVQIWEEHLEGFLHAATYVVVKEGVSSAMVYA